MQVIIIDSTGSVSEEQLQAGTDFAKSLHDTMDPKRECLCLITLGNTAPPLAEMIASFKKLKSDCTIHLITNGMITQDRLDDVKCLYVYENTVQFTPDYVKSRILYQIPLTKKQDIGQVLETAAAQEWDRLLIKLPHHNHCDHGVRFDERAARGLSASEVQKRWPRLFGLCPKGCGFNGIGYASYMHYISGDW